MAKAIKKLVVKTGTYINKEGAEKNQYENIGVVMKGDDGGAFMLIKKTFNPAGVNNGKDSVVVSAFNIDDKENDSKNNQKKPEPHISQQEPNDEIPF